MSLIDELKRRNVFRVGIAYAIAGWLIIQVADVATESFAAPDWVMKILFLVVVLGFFVALILAWAFELTPQGVKRDSEVAVIPAGQPKPAGRLNSVILVMLVAAIAFLLFERFSGTPPDALPPTSESVEASVAVLPFVNMSANQENEFFSDGLTDTLLHMLAQVPDLKVAARTSSFAFKGQNTDIRDIARDLNVANVLEGSVQRAGNTVRITAQLIQANDGYHLWSATFDRSLDDIFAVQDEIARQVASALSGSLLGAEQAAGLHDGSTANTEAYDLYLRGREAYWGSTEREAAASVRLMRRAVTLDPNYALAWSGLSQALVLHGTRAGLSWDDIRDEAMAAAEKGVELAPESSTTLAALGKLHRDLRDNARARGYLEKAVALNPNDVWALSYLSDSQFADAEFAKAVETAQRAMALDPLDFNLKAASVHKFNVVGRTAEGEILARAVLQQDPNSTNGLSALGNLYWRTGRHAEAFRVYHHMLEINPNTFYVMDRIAQSYYELGDPESALRWLEKAAAVNPDRTAFDFARHCKIIGDLPCVEQRYEAILAESNTPEEAERAQFNLDRLHKDWPALLTTLENEIAKSEDRENRFWTINLRLMRAHAADQVGDLALRDRELDKAISRTEDDFQRGGNSHYSYTNLAEAWAIRGDAARATENLAKAIELGFVDVTFLTEDGQFDKVMADPQFKALVEQLRADNKTRLSELQAAEAEMMGGE